jgi:hypothetical protein
VGRQPLPPPPRYLQSNKCRKGKDHQLVPPTNKNRFDDSTQIYKAFYTPFSLWHSSAQPVGLRDKSSRRMVARHS